MQLTNRYLLTCKLVRMQKLFKRAKGKAIRLDLRESACQSLNRRLAIRETYPIIPHYHTIPYHTIPYHTIPYHTIPYHTIPYHTIPYHTIPYHTIPYHTIPYHTIPYHTIPYHTIPYHTIPYHTIPYHTIPYHTIPYHTAPYHSEPHCTTPYLITQHHAIAYHTTPCHSIPHHITSHHFTSHHFTCTPDHTIPSTSKTLALNSVYILAESRRTIQHPSRCLTISHYHHYKTKYASNCQLACEEDPQCLMAMYNADKQTCYLGSQKKSFRRRKKCADSNTIFEKIGIYDSDYDGVMISNSLNCWYTRYILCEQVTGG